MVLIILATLLMVFATAILGMEMILKDAIQEVATAYVFCLSAFFILILLA